MMLDKRVNFFLCVVLVTCTSPLYKRTLLYDDDQLDQRLSAYLDSTEWPDWLDSVRIHEGHSEQSSHSSNLAFLGDIDSTSRGVEEWEAKKGKFSEGVRDLFTTHLQQCGCGSAADTKLQDRHHFDDHNACVCYVGDKAIVRVTNPGTQLVIDISRLRSPVRILFEMFYNAVPFYSSAGRRDFPDYNLDRLNAALNWLWNVLTKHEDHDDSYSLPVIGILNSGTKKEQYKFGELQASIIDFLSTKGNGNTKPAAGQLARKLAQSYDP